MLQQKTDSRYKKWIAWIPVLIIMIIIFSFSAKEADTSAHTSSKLTDIVVNIMEHLSDVTIKTGSPAYETLHTCVRKLGHLSEYMALGFFLVFPYSFHAASKFRLFAYCEITAILYAGSDEFHQLFVKGRDGNLLDVGIDSLGALIGIGIAMLILFQIHKKKTTTDTPVS